MIKRPALGRQGERTKNGDSGKPGRGGTLEKVRDPEGSSHVNCIHCPPLFSAARLTVFTTRQENPFPEYGPYLHPYVAQLPFQGQ
jgi:hypothetical protein